MMDIAHVTPTFPPYEAGTGNVALQNARSLAQLGHEVTVYTAAAPGSSPSSMDGVRVRRLRTPFRIGNAPLLPGLLRIKHDILHLHYPFIFGAEMVWALRRLRRQPYVLTYHNDLVFPGPKGLLFKLYERLWARRVMAAAGRVIVTSWDGAEASHVLGPMIRAHRSRFTEIPNGVDLSLFSPRQDGSAARDTLGIAPQQRVLLFVGSLDSAHHSKSGVPVLLEAVARLHDPELFVLIVGDGDRVGEYKALARDRDLDRQVRFVGKVPNHELPMMYNASDIVVQASQRFEPFGLVAVEAMACGKPVVVSDLPGVRRVVSEAGGGVLARPGDPDDVAAKIRALVEDPLEMKRLGSVGRSGVERLFDWAQIGAKLEATYREALETR
jgi:glycosyltransferase involved in cell wall biosynthesis